MQLIAILLWGAMSNFTINDESSNHKYRTELPNIIYEIGLTPNLIGVYFALKRAAGDNGQCTKSEKTLSKQLNITKKTLHGLITQLCEVNPILKKPLVNCTNRFSECGDKDTNSITITDIWSENYSYFSGDLGGRVKITPPSVKITQPRVNSTQGVGEKLPQGRVKITHKEEPIKKNQYEEEQHTPKAPLKFGACVILFSSDYEKFCQDNGKVKIDLLIEEMNDYCQAHGKSYRGEMGYAAALRNWIRRRKEDISFKNVNTDRRTKNIDGTPVTSPVDGRF